MDSDDIVVVENSGGESDSEISVGPRRSSWLRRVHNEINIRSKIERARALLENAERLSCPYNMSTSEQNNQNRYAISNVVTARDFFCESDLLSLCNLTSILKNRLNIERIYNLGRPQCDEERALYDELVTQFADLIADGTIRARDRILSRENENIESVVTNEREVVAHSNLNSEVVSDSQMTSPLSQEVNRGGDQLTSDIVNSSSVEQSVSQFVGSNPHVSTAKILESVSDLRQIFEQTPESVIKDSNILRAVSDFVEELKKSQMLFSDVSTSSKSPKSKKPSSKRRRAESRSCDDEKDGLSDEEESCSICLESWTSGGVHRICCLKCGHLFGHSCILKWIKQAGSCPQCKLPAKKEDIRGLFARKLTAEDTSERDRALKLLEEEKAKARDLEHKEAFARRNADTQKHLVAALEGKLSYVESLLDAQMKLGIPGTNSASSSQVSLRCGGPVADLLPSQCSLRDKKYQHLARISIAQDGNCRVFEYSQELGMLVVSTKSANPLFRGFGIKTLSRDFRILSYQPLHSALIRDMSFRTGTYDGTLLSCGMDKVVQLTSVNSKCVIQKFALEGSGWSCAWNPGDNNLFYVGMERGLVKEFDMRRTDGPVQDIVNLGGAPISSVQYWKSQDLGDRCVQGVLISQTRNLIFREKRENQFSTHMLPSPQAPMMSVCLSPDGFFLTSFRPGANNSRCHYEVSRLVSCGSVSSCKIASWEGSNLQAVISRNCIFCVPESEGNFLAATANHMSNTVNVWDVSRKRVHQELNCFDKAIDIKPISTSQQELLGALSDSELVLYKWQ